MKETSILFAVMEENQLIVVYIHRYQTDFALNIGHSLYFKYR